MANNKNIVSTGVLRPRKGETSDDPHRHHIRHRYVLPLRRLGSQLGQLSSNGRPKPAGSTQSGRGLEVAASVDCSQLNAPALRKIAGALAPENVGDIHDSSLSRRGVLPEFASSRIAP
jgi:hypothetical protein